MTYVVGPRNLRRWEIEILPHEDPAGFESFDNVRRKLAPFVDTEHIDIWRAATYRFHALVAHEWRRGRVFLAGDAAHQMPPFMAQGLCSGIRDAGNLGWKLIAVLQGRAAEPLLETYEIERKPHIRELVETTKQWARSSASSTGSGRGSATRRWDARSTKAGPKRCGSD